jgi:hypothetical protein
MERFSFKTLFLVAAAHERQRSRGPSGGLSGPFDGLFRSLAESPAGSGRPKAFRRWLRQLMRL